MPSSQPAYHPRTPNRRGPGQRAGLSAEAVLGEARRLLNQEGVDRVTMRALADRLGVAPNALYSYFLDKSALLDELLDLLLAEVDTRDLEAMDWREGLSELMGRSRRLLLAHADLLPHYLARPMRGENAIRLGESTLSLLAKAGLRGDAEVDALRILLAYTFGYAAMEAPRRAEPEPERRRKVSAAAFQAAAARPHMAELAEPLTRPMTGATFEAGLGWLLDGMAAAHRREP
jgi:AcrR family transcriptional regulator